MITAVARTPKVKTPLLYKVLGPAMAVPAGILVRKTADTAWLKVRGYPPPKNPAAPGVSWPDAAAWAAVSGVLGSMGWTIISLPGLSGWRWRGATAGTGRRGHR